jgi:hypothetical protein
MVKDLNETFNSYFYKKVTFLLDNKPIKDGRLKLFTMKGFNLKFFILDDNNDIKNIELPYPFKFTKNKSGYLFDYRLSAFKLIQNPELVYSLTEKDFVKSRYFDKLLEIKIE